MHIEEIDRYKMACRLSRHDMKEYGISHTDLMDRTPMARMFFSTAIRLCKAGTDYEWPGCGLTMEIKFYDDETVVIFSERVDDYIYNLRQTLLTLDGEQAESLEEFINLLNIASEEEQRNMIRSFEKNISEVQ